MKKITTIVLSTILMTASIFAQNIKPFGKKEAKEGSWTIYADKFEGKNIAIQKYIGSNLAGKGLIRLLVNFYPYFIFNDETKTVTPRINMQTIDVWGTAVNETFNKGQTYKYSWATKMIFIADGKKTTINFLSAEQKQNGKEIEVDFALSREQFETLIEIMSSKEVVCAMYNEDKTAGEVYNDGKRLNTTALNARTFFDTHFSEYTIPETNEIELN